MAGEGGKKLATLSFKVELYEHGPPVVWLGRNLEGRPSPHVPLPKPLLDALEAYVRQVVRGE